MKTSKWKESVIAKIFGVILLCLIGTAMVYGAFGIAFLADFGVYDQKVMDYYEVAADRYCFREGQRIMSDLIANGPEKAESNYSEENSNCIYVVEKWNPETGVFEPYSANRTAESGVTETLFYMVDEYQNVSGIASIPDQTDASETKGDRTEQAEETYEYYKMTLSIAKPIKANDVFAGSYELFNLFYPLRNQMVIAECLLGLAMVIILILELTAAGHRSEETGIYVSWFDKIPLGLVWGGSALALGGLAEILRGIDYVVFPNNMLNSANWWIRFLPIILVLMIASLVIYANLITLSVRIKSRKLFRYTLCWYVFQFIIFLFHIIPGTFLFSLISGGVILLLIMTAAAGDSLLALSLALAFAGWVFLVWCVFQMKKLGKAGQAMADGEVDFEIPLNRKRMLPAFYRHGENLSSLMDGMRLAVDQKMKSEHLKTELITNVSHDIKTPLTSIINYVDLLQKDHTEEEEKQYLEVLSRQSGRLKKLTEDLIEASKASTGNLPCTLEQVELQELLNQSVAEYQDKLTAGHLTPVVDVENPPVYVLADGRLLWRVFSNLLSNVVKYAMPDTRIYWAVVRAENRTVKITMKNVSRDSLNISSDELMERFVRGDSSRSTEGSGLGLAIAKSLVELQKGTFSISIDGDLFKAEIVLTEYAPEKEVFKI